MKILARENEKKLLRDEAVNNQLAINDLFTPL